MTKPALPLEFENFKQFGQWLEAEGKRIEDETRGSTRLLLGKAEAFNYLGGMIATDAIVVKPKEDPQDVWVYVLGNGDRSVGIWDYQLNINLGHEDLDCADEQRELVRHTCEELGELLSGQKCYAWFGDECGDCRSPKKGGVCTNPNCVSNIPDQEDQWPS